MGRFRMACIGGWHVHGLDFAKKAQGMESCDIKAVCCDSRETASQWAAQLNCRIEEESDAIFKANDIDGVIITTSTASHKEMIMKAAKAGKHVFVEKALAVSAEDAYEIKSAVLKSGIKFVMSDPVRKGPRIWAKKMVDQGLLGTITNVRMRSVHPEAIVQGHLPHFYNTAESGGGALIDVGSHAAGVLAWFLGRPVQSAGVFHSYTKLGKNTGADENAVAVYKFEGGAIGTIEAGWYSPKYQCELDIYGTEGCICISEQNIYYHLNGGDWKIVPRQEIPEDDIYPLYGWINCVLYGETCEQYGIENAVIVTEILTAAMNKNRVG